MPIYEYECDACGKTFEATQKISDKPLKSCKFCQGAVRRLISSSSFTLKGGGWYKDGYSKSPPKGDKKGGETKAKPKAEAAKSPAAKSPGT